MFFGALEGANIAPLRTQYRSS